MRARRLFAVVLSFVVSLILAYAIKATIGLRSTEEDELAGLDLALHGEKGYHLEDDLIGGSYSASASLMGSAVPATAH